MATLDQRVAKILSKSLKQGQADLEILPNGYIYGFVVSAEFEGLDYQARRLRIREILDRSVKAGKLSQEELQRVGTLLTYTPAEWSVQVENSSRQ